MISFPEKLETILQKDKKLYALFMGFVAPFSDILEDNRHYFFPEYTDHGIKHIEDTLQYAENLIADETFSHLTTLEVGIMLLSVVLHDIGMHTNAEMFRNMIEGKYDNLVDLLPDGKTWKELWNAFLYDSQYWGEEKKKNVFGNPSYSILTPDLSDLQGLTEYDKKLIGEFIRTHHCRIAHEIALNGYIGRETIRFGSSGNDYEDYFKIAGIVARSHGMNVRDTFDYLDREFGDNKTPFGIHVVYLMILIRLADYLQIDSSRTNQSLLLINTLNSPYSKQEHKTHRSIKNVQFSNTDKEKILIHARPNDALTYVKIERLVQDIQKEFDRSWAILGEVYIDNHYRLSYRRITTNISNSSYKDGLTYVPQRFGFSYNNDLFKLLIAPLYGDDPSYGVRELVQNAVDACRLCMRDLTDAEPHVIVEVDSKRSLFTITDKGKGMNLYEIKNYFLTIGSSFNDNIDWKKARDHGHIFRTGRFGIGILAAFLLGPNITVITRKRNEDTGYHFTASLHDRFIQIDKVKDAEYGTKIMIQCSADCLAKLRESNGNEWFNWYIGEKPTVVYYYDGVPREVKRNLDGYQELIHSSNRFGTVYWKPNRIFQSLSELYCNGFFVSWYSNKSRFSLPGFSGFDLIRIPNLQITDTYNQLPLNLQRNDIDAKVSYDFEPELAREVFVDMMCQMVASDVRRFSLNEVQIHANGFSLQSGYIRNCVREKRVITLNLHGIRGYSRWSHPNPIPFATSLKDSNCFIAFAEDESNAKIDNLLMFSRRITRRMSDKKLEEMFRYEMGDACFAISDDRTLWKELSRFNQFLIPYKGWRIYSHSSSIQLLKKIIDNLEDYAIQSIWVEEHQKSVNPETILDELFAKYMNGDPIIPFEINERKQKFPLLFQDYSNIIEKYNRYAVL